LSQVLLNREDLVQDTQATLREVAGILHELWDLQGPNDPVQGISDGFLGASAVEPDLETVVESAHREILSIQEEVGILQRLIPLALYGADHPRDLSLGMEGIRDRKATRALEILTEILERLNKLAGELEHQTADAD